MEIGDRLYCVTLNRGFNPGEYVTLSKIGKVYFEVKELPHTKFYKETLVDKSNYSSNYRLYLNKQDYDDEVLKHDLASKIQKDIYNLKNKSLDVVKQVYNLMYDK